ncbi:protein MCM10 homolog [Sitodiplosis mosellana]|uniref:protein MCM10 homolog n=1 Tax=Sitodiplosis mosellana TaxID=263140 RepID=UPI00244376B2|nr:protein MCM10 homolog [Sitodiplosis mosellana]
MNAEYSGDELADLLQDAADEGEITLNDTTVPKIPINSDIAAVRDVYDSSDEEDLQNFFERKYNEYGRDINHLLKRKDADHVDAVIGNEVSKNLRLSDIKFGLSASQKSVDMPVSVATCKTTADRSENVYIDPIFGLRLVQPLISSTALRERMLGRTNVEIRSLQHHLQNSDLSKDWCISGVIVSKGPVQKSNAGSHYIIWRLSDLKGDMKTVSLFLFKSAYKELWKTGLGMIVAVLNPSVFSRKDNNGESSLSIDSAQRVMILGRSKDYGICKSKKKNGEPCTAVVNLGICEFCVYHVKQEYGKMSGRSELQSSTSGRGLNSLRNKILGKSEVFYGGKSFMAEPSKPSQKLKAKDQQRLMSLSNTSTACPLGATTTGKVNYLSSNSPAASRVAEGMEANFSQRRKDLARLKSLDVDVSTLSTTQQNQSTILNDSKPSLLPNINIHNTAPTLSSFTSFSFTIGKSSYELAKAKAIAVLRKNPIEKSNPNFVKYRGTEAGKKRAHCVIETSEVEHPKKKQKLAEEVEQFKNERIQKLLQIRSSHVDLIEAHDTNVQNNYFNKLEKKEAMEEKMLNTTKMDCKAVICVNCKYKAFSAAQRCKEENHKFKVVDVEKRFFECEDCGNRTISLFRIPRGSCNNCQSSRWKRTGMIRDKSTLETQPLSIRGDEETFIGSLQTNGNINLCVAADE